MATKTSIRNKLATKVFAKLGSSCTVASVASESTDKWGDATTVYATAVTTSCVPYDYITKRQDYQPFGDLSQGESVMVFPYDTVLHITDKVVFATTTYVVKQIEDFYYDGGSIAKSVLISESMS